MNRKLWKLITSASTLIENVAHHIRASFYLQEGKISVFKPYSKYPPCYKDVTFWLPEGGFHNNDMFELVRDVAGDLVEEVFYLERSESMLICPVTVDVMVEKRNERPKLGNFRTPVDTSTLRLNCLDKKKTSTVVTEKEYRHGGHGKQI